MYNTSRPDLNRRKLWNKLGQGLKFLIILFFLYFIKEWLKLDDEIRIIESSKQFKKIILDFTGPKKILYMQYMIYQVLNY